jgi:hypothetical protein
MPRQLRYMLSRRGADAAQPGGFDMSVHAFLRRASHAAIGVGLAALLAGCFFAPGKFTSQLDLRKNGGFTFAYQGEITMLALSKLADMSRDSEEFKPDTCYDDDFKERDCTKDELDEQRQTWEAGKESRKAEDAKNMRAMQAMLGGVDPSDPKAAQELAARLMRQKGWNSVRYEGNGLYMVDFSVTGRMDHDFVFPVVEGFPMANSFVTATVRDGNAVRIEAPGFTGQSLGGMPLAALMQAAGQGKDAPVDANEPPAPKVDGTFSIVTDGTILANNTDEGPKAAATGQQLSWTINARTTTAPVALIQLAN